MTRNEIIGRRVCDIVSGFTGICTSDRTELTGATQVGVQPACSPDKPDALPDAISFDIQTIEIVDTGVAHVVTPEPEGITVALGHKVVDTITGAEGIATARSSFINGCVYFVIQPNKMPDGKIPDGLFLPWNRLTVLGAKTPEVVKTPTGGPSLRIPAARAPR